MTVLPGLAAPVEVTLDRWGVAHVVAASAPDVFRAQGYLVARERLFQLDLWLRRGTGRLAAAFGPRFAERDRAARLFLYRGESDLDGYAPDAAAVCAAFTDGINAFVEACEADPSLLPPEFARLGHRPLRWRPDDVARVRSHGLFDNALQEVERALVVREHGVEVEDLRRKREPWAPLEVPSGLDLAEVHPDALHDYRLAMSAVSLDGIELPSAAASADGSNNWVLAPGRTATGRPLLAGDPHRALTLPSLRYVVHLTCDEFDVIGAGEPVLPGVSIGHNGRVGFGLTIFPTDQEDVYVYETDGDRYRYEDGWEPFRVVHETVEVAGDEPVEVELRFTRHGPVTFAADGRAYAVRAAWLEPGMAPYLASLAYLRAGSAEEFRSALDRWRAPSVNHVFADVTGAIGWAARGLVPDRPNWDGLLPVPGDGRYEWAGFRSHEAFPAEADPERGWIATANQLNLRPGQLERPVSREWLAPFRHRRISEVLDARSDWTVAGLAELQRDVLSLPARRVLEVVAELAPTWPEEFTASLAAMLAGWDRRMTGDSAAAALFETWFRGPLRTALLAGALGDLGYSGGLDVVDPGLRETLTGDPQIDLELLERAEPDWLRPVLATTLAEAGSVLRERLGPDVRTWRWDALHHARFRHPAGAAAPADWHLGPFPKGGSPDTVDVSARDGDGVQTTGATFRMVLDVGDWDASVATNGPGQSGRPGSPHYADLVPSWLGAPFPLTYSAAAVAAVATDRLTLTPEGPPA